MLFRLLGDVYYAAGRKVSRQNCFHALTAEFLAHDDVVGPVSTRHVQGLHGLSQGVHGRRADFLFLGRQQYKRGIE